MIPSPQAVRRRARLAIVVWAGLWTGSAGQCADLARLAFSSARPEKGSAIHIMDSRGVVLRQLTDTRYEGHPAWAADGAMLAFTSSRDGDPGDGPRNPEIYAMAADGAGQVNLTNHPGADSRPVWSPDGSKIAFVSTRQDGFTHDVFVMDADGSNQVNLTGGSPFDTEPDWSPDGRRIAFLYRKREAGYRQGAGIRFLRYTRCTRTAPTSVV